MVRLPSAACSLPLWTSKKERNGLTVPFCSASCACVWKDGTIWWTSRGYKLRWVKRPWFPKETHLQIWWNMVVLHGSTPRLYWRVLGWIDHPKSALGSHEREPQIIGGGCFFPKSIAGWWFGTWILCSMSYMGFHPSHWRTPSFFKMVKTHHQPDWISNPTARWYPQSGQAVCFWIVLETPSRCFRHHSDSHRIHVWYIC